MSRLPFTLEIELLQLPPLRIACARGFGPEARQNAWREILAWAQATGIFPHLSSHRIFGTDAPVPPRSPESFEIWISVGPEAYPAHQVGIRSFPGARCAVARCVGRKNASLAWDRLRAWCARRSYSESHHLPRLEEYLNPFLPRPDEAVFNLWLPLDEPVSRAARRSRRPSASYDASTETAGMAAG